MMPLLLLSKSAVVDFVITDDITPLDYKFHSEFEDYLLKNKSYFKKIIVRRPVDFEPCGYQGLKVDSNDIIIIPHWEFNRYDHENLYFICESNPNTWNNLKELTLHYYIHDIRAEREKIEDDIKALQKRLNELKT